MSRGQDVASETALPVTAAEPPAAAQAAPQAVKRSMPMAISLTLGLLGAAFFLWFFYHLAWFLLLLYLSLVIATILDAPVRYLRGKGVPRGLSTVVLMFGGLAVLLVAAYFLANSVYHQFLALAADIQKAPAAFTSFSRNLTERFPMLGGSLANVDWAGKFSAALPELSAIWSRAWTGFEAVTYLVVLFFAVMYMVIEGPDHLVNLRRLVPKSGRLAVTRVFEDMGRAHRGWFLASGGNVLSSSILTTIGLLLLGIPGAPILGVIAGCGELAPNIGPFFTALPTLLLVLVTNPHKFLYVVAMFLVVGTIQGYTISPHMMKIGVRLPVLVLLVSVVVMGTLFGVLGVVTAVPLTADLVVLWNYLNEALEKDPPAADVTNAAPAAVRMPPGPRNPGDARPEEGSAIREAAGQAAERKRV